MKMVIVVLISFQIDKNREILLNKIPFHRAPFCRIHVHVNRYSTLVPSTRGRKKMCKEAEDRCMNEKNKIIRANIIRFEKYCINLF